SDQATGAADAPRAGCRCPTEPRRARDMRSREERMTALPEPAGRLDRFLGRRGSVGVGLSRTEALVLLIPAMLPILILSVTPLLRGIYLGFTDSHAGFGVATHFIGLKNFRTLLHDSLFVNSFKIGAIWAVSVTAIQFCLALGLALLLNQPLRGRWL